MRVVILSIVAACTAPQSAPPKPATPVPSLPPLYASLFEAGKTWQFPLQAAKQWDEGNGIEKATTTGTMKCTVSNVRTMPGRRRAELHCNPNVADRSLLEYDASGDLMDSPGGTYVGTPTGLWQVPSNSSDDAVLDPNQMLLAANPSAHRTEPPDSSDSIEVVKQGNGWCYTLLHELDWCPEGWSLCLREGDGVIGGNGIRWGVDTRLVYFGEAPRY